MPTVPCVPTITLHLIVVATIECAYVIGARQNRVAHIRKADNEQVGFRGDWHPLDVAAIKLHEHLVFEKGRHTVRCVDGHDENVLLQRNASDIHGRAVRVGKLNRLVAIWAIVVNDTQANSGAPAAARRVRELTNERVAVLMGSLPRPAAEVPKSAAYSLNLDNEVLDSGGGCHPTGLRIGLHGGYTSTITGVLGRAG